MIKATLASLFILIFVGCNSSVNRRANESKSETENGDICIDLNDVAVKCNGVKIDTSEVVTIKNRCVLFVQMTQRESDSLESADPESYMVFSENANNASMNALDLVSSLKVENVWSDKRYIIFEQNGDKYLLDTRLKNIAGSYCILFSNGEMPTLVEVESLSEDIVRRYFK